MKLEEALLEVLKDSPANANVKKCDVERAMALMAAPPAEAPKVKKPANEPPPGA